MCHTLCQKAWVATWDTAEKLDVPRSQDLASADTVWSALLEAFEGGDIDRLTQIIPQLVSHPEAVGHFTKMTDAMKEKGAWALGKGPEKGP